MKAHTVSHKDHRLGSCFLPVLVWLSPIERSWQDIETPARSSPVFCSILPQALGTQKSCLQRGTSMERTSRAILFDPSPKGEPHSLLGFSWKIFRLGEWPEWLQMNSSGAYLQSSGGIQQGRSLMPKEGSSDSVRLVPKTLPSSSLSSPGP